MEAVFCYATAKTLLDCFPDAHVKLASPIFGHVNLRSYREKLDKAAVLEKFATLIHGVYSTREVLRGLFVHDPFLKAFSNKAWRELVIQLALQMGQKESKPDIKTAEDAFCAAFVHVMAKRMPSMKESLCITCFADHAFDSMKDQVHRQEILQKYIQVAKVAGLTSDQVISSVFANSDPFNRVFVDLALRSKVKRMFVSLYFKATHTKVCQKFSSNAPTTEQWCHTHTPHSTGISALH